MIFKSTLFELKNRIGLFLMKCDLYDFFTGDLMAKRIIKKSRKRKGGLLGFAITKKNKKDCPPPLLRKAIAYNIDRIEKYIGTKLSRTEDGNIKCSLGGGTYGVIFDLDNGNVLKVTTDKTEAANALFWKGAQRRNAILQHGTAKIYSIIKIRDRKNQIFGLIEREKVETPCDLDFEVNMGLNAWADNFIAYCSEDDEELKKDYVSLARDSLLFLSKRAPALQESLTYSWNKGIPQIDAHPSNVGMRIEPLLKNGHSGDIVIFDFGLHVSTCWKVLHQNAEGIPVKLKNQLLKFDKKIKVLRR